MSVLVDRIDACVRKTGVLFSASNGQPGFFGRTDPNARSDLDRVEYAGLGYRAASASIGECDKALREFANSYLPESVLGSAVLTDARNGYPYIRLSRGAVLRWEEFLATYVTPIPPKPITLTRRPSPEFVLNEDARQLAMGAGSAATEHTYLECASALRAKVSHARSLLHNAKLRPHHQTVTGVLEDLLDALDGLAEDWEGVE